MPGPVPYTDIGGGGPNPPHGEDFFDRIVNVHWPEEGGLAALFIPMQGLLASYTGAVLSGELIAQALDSGQTFSDTNMGATGMGYTVLTRGVICFGKPRNGDPCFLACPDCSNGAFASVLRGTLSDIKGNLDDFSVELKWESVSEGKVIAVSFAAGAFFIVYQDPTVHDPVTVEASYDGLNFSTTQAISANEQLNPVGGSVAGLENSYVLGASVDVGTPEDPYYGIHGNLAWAISSDGVGWNFDYNSSLLGNPGALIGQFFSIASASNIAAGNGVFVAASTDKKSIISDSELPYITHTAAASMSTNGTDWSTNILPGAIAAGGNSYSFSTCVVFVPTEFDVKTGESIGYFLCGGYGNDEGTTKGGVWVSTTGSGWSQVLQNVETFNWTLSIIAKDLSQTKIVRV